MRRPDNRIEYATASSRLSNRLDSTMVQSEFLRLQRIRVDGLFGTYNHDINLNLKDRVTLLHGPNGVGKTVILGMVSALLQERFDYFRRIPFSRFSLEFHDGSNLELQAYDETEIDDRPYQLKLTRNGTSQSAKVGHSHGVADIAEKVDFLRPHGSIEDTWIDMRDEEVLYGGEVLSRYADMVSPPENRDDDLSWFSNFLKNANAHFIVAQRLVRMDSEPRGWHEFGGRKPRRLSMISTVVDCSRDYRKRLANNMAQYGRQSQALDQSFPQRLMGAVDELGVPELQDRMTQLDEKTSNYKKMGILDRTTTHPFPVSSLGNIDSTQARVMTLYVQDTDKKLQALEDLATRTRLLLDNVNEKYRHKRIQLDRERGFVATSDSGQPLSLSSLSSGEQQELVLHYDLLFRVPSNTIVLIDEPELSLHVAWQKKFLPDLLVVVRLSNFDALVATHSPFIVGDRTDLMIGLGDLV